MKLYPFQKEMVDFAEYTRSVLCGDEMGLGKTYEALALDLRRRMKELDGRKQTDYPTLIVAPLSVIDSWRQHLLTIWPKAKVAVIDAKYREALLAKLSHGGYHYYLIHWEGVRLMPELQSITWWHIIADEVHRAKNKSSQQTIALKKLKTRYKTGLSGTPADNHPQDLWSILNWLYPKTWTSFITYCKRHVKIRVHNKGACMAHDPETGTYCDGYHKHGFRETLGVADVEGLHEAMAPFYIRRTKEAVIKDLPPKYYTTIKVELLPKQRRIYEQMKAEMLAWVGKHEHEAIAAPVVIAQLIRLQQFALAYAELETVKRRKKDCTEPRCEEAGKCFGHNVDVVKLSDPSSKLDALVDILTDNPEEQFVVFSQSRQMINLVGARLARLGISHALFTGDTTPEDRAEIVKKFQAGEIRVFAGTIKAGGEGITLTAASTVIFLDRDWNPSKNKQAEDRCHRIGQRSAVQVIDIQATDTVDAGRHQHIKLKWSWLKALLGDKKAAEEENAERVSS